MTEELDGKDVFDNWDQLLQASDAGKEIPAGDLDLSGLMGKEEKGPDYWENLFQESNFGGMNLMGLSYFPLTIQEDDFFKKYTAAKRVFMADILAHNINDLRSAGISEENIFYLSKGVLPANWTIHLKYPPLYGGLPEPDNMVMIQCQPFHELIHDFINKQILTNAGLGHPKTLYVPTPVGKVYIPEGAWTGSGGKKKADRSVMAGMTQGALQQLSQKVGGR
ncbi:MAG: hypothetical protein IKQ99_00685 [Alphaproteobacteria bacterium]|nr:hypothetical protein [Alphaproteobacteria bacterium]